MFDQVYHGLDFLTSRDPRDWGFHLMGHGAILSGATFGWHGGGRFRRIREVLSQTGESPRKNFSNRTPRRGIHVIYVMLGYVLTSVLTL
jgi:hypothetical protein